MFNTGIGEHVFAGTNEVYCWGNKAQERVAQYLEPNEKGFYSIPVDGRKYYSIGTSQGKYGEFAKWKDTFFSVNSWGYAWAKVGTEKAEKFVEMINDMLETMRNM